MLDVVGTTPQAIEKFLEFLVDTTKMPLLIDGAGSNEVNIAGLRYSKTQGFSDRILLNSIVPETPPEVLEAMRESDVTSAILLTYSSMAVISSSKRVELVEELVEKAKLANVNNVMVDTVVLDIPTLGLAIKALQDIKDKFGLPAGCGAHNSIDTWRGLKTKMGTQATIPSLVAANIVAVTGGADFILYGPVEHAPYIFPPVAMVDTALSQILMEQGIKPGKDHPRRKIG